MTTTLTVTTERERDAIKPGRWELALRTCVLYQLWRFLWLNLRMLRIARMSHGS
jgi:hypothetical protein